jgi:hypothetical protein
MSAIVTFAIELNFPEWGHKRAYATKTMELPGVPVRGDYVNLTDSGWSEPVRLVWWGADDGLVRVELGHKSMVIITAQSDVIADLRNEGWTVTGAATTHAEEAH